MADPTLQSLWYDPLFQDLNYNEQMEIRLKVAQRQLGQDANFLKLPQQAKQEVLREIVTAPPAFRNKGLEQLVSKVGMSVLRGKGKELLPELGTVQQRQGRPIISTKGRNIGPEGGRLWVTAEHEVLNAIGQAQWREWELLGALYGNIQKKYQIERPMDQRFDIPLGYLSLPERFPEEGEKILQYYDIVSNADSRVKRWGNFLKAAFPILGTGVDIAVMYGLGAGTYKVPKGLGKLAMAPWEKAWTGKGLLGFLGKTRAGTLTARIGGQAAHGVATAALWTGREIAMDILNNKLPENADLKYFFKYGIKRFGEAYLFDFLFNMIEGIVWPMTKGMGKAFSKGFKMSNLWESLEGEETSRIISSILSGGFVDPAFVATLPEKAKRIVQSTYNARRVFQHVPRLNAENMLQAMGLVSGWNVTPKAAGGYLLEQTTGDVVKEFSDFASTAKFINEAAMTLREPVTRTTRDAILSGAAYDKVRLRKVISGTLSDVSYENVDVLSRLIAPTGGRWTKGKVKAFGRASLRAIGADEETIAKFSVREWGGEGPFGKITAMINKEEIATFPLVVQSAQQETDAIKGFLKAIEPYKAGKFNIGEDLVREYKSSLARQNLFTPSWIEDQVKNTLGGEILKNPQGGWFLRRSIGSAVFDSYDDIGKYVISETIEPEWYSNYLKERFGLSLRMKKETGEAMIADPSRALGRQTVARAENFRALVRENPMFLDKIPSDLGPRLTVTTEGTLRVRYVDGVLTGPYHKILEELNKFGGPKTNKKFVKVRSGKEGSVQVHKITKEIEVYLPDIAYRAPVRTIKEAENLLSTGIADWENLKFISHSKGYRITPWGEGFAFYTVDDTGGKGNFTRTLAETESLLEGVPIPEWAPELTGLTQQDIQFNKIFLGGTPIPENMFKPTEFTTPTRVDGLPWNTVFSQLYRPPEAWLVKAVEQGGDPNLLRYFREVEKIRQFVRGQEYFSSEAIRAIFTERTPAGKLGKKMMPKKDRVKVGAYLLTRRSDPAAAGKLFENLTDWQKDTARQIQELAFGTDVETGMALKFAISPTDWLEDYAPKIRKFYLENPKKAFSEGRTHRYLKEVFDGKEPPTNLDAFFRHSRVSDLINMSLEDDPLTMLLRYSATGHREHYFGPIWREARDYMKKALKSGKTGEQMASRFAVYMSQIMGMPEGLGEKMVRDTLQGLFAKFGVKGRLGGDIVSKIISLNYLSFMGFRPWLPIRNSFQIWTTLAPRIGNDWTIAGLQDVANDSAGEIYQFLRARGVMTGTLPLFGAEEVLGAAGTRAGKGLQKITHMGLQWYKNSDDFTRAVAWRASYRRFMDSVDRLQRGIWKNLDPDKATKRFLEMSGASQVHRDLKEEIKFFMRNNQVQEAAQTFASWMTEQTLFPYRKGMSPLWSKGMVGKFFGMFGTYPAYYIENFRTALKNMPRAAKAAYIARFLGNSALLYVTFKEGLGINAYNFVPWQPASFTGGPMWDMMGKAIKTLDTKSYAGRQARAELIGLTTRDGKPSMKFFSSDLGRVMTGYQLRSIIDAVNDFQEGEIYRGILNLGSFPINPDWWGE